MTGDVEALEQRRRAPSSNVPSAGSASTDLARSEDRVAGERAVASRRSAWRTPSPRSRRSCWSSVSASSRVAPLDRRREARRRRAGRVVQGVDDRPRRCHRSSLLRGRYPSTVPTPRTRAARRGAHATRSTRGSSAASPARRRTLCALRPPQRVRAAGGDRAVRAVHRRARQPGHARRCSPRTRRPRRSPAAPRDDVEELVHTTGFFHAKARHLQGLSAALLERFGGEVPERRCEELARSPASGARRRTSCVSVAFDEPGLPVDTHVTRLSHRLDLSRGKDPVAIERTLCRALAPRALGGVQHPADPPRARDVRGAAPAARACVLEDLCPQAGRAR